MAQSKRQDILDNIEVTLNDLSEVKTVIMYEPHEFDRAMSVLPLAMIFALEDSESGFLTELVGTETWDWIVGIEVWFDPNNNTKFQEALLKTIVDAMYVDTTRGGCAIDTKRISTDHFQVYNDRTSNIKGFALQFRIIYRTAYGIM